MSNIIDCQVRGVNGDEPILCKIVSKLDPRMQKFVEWITYAVLWVLAMSVFCIGNYKPKDRTDMSVLAAEKIQDLTPEQIESFLNKINIGWDELELMLFVQQLTAVNINLKERFEKFGFRTFNDFLASDVYKQWKIDNPEGESYVLREPVLKAVPVIQEWEQSTKALPVVLITLNDGTKKLVWVVHGEFWTYHVNLDEKRTAIALPVDE